MSKSPTKPRPTPSVAPAAGASTIPGAALMLGRAHAAPAPKPGPVMAYECSILRVANGFIVKAGFRDYTRNRQSVHSTFAAALAAVTQAIAPPPKAPRPTRKS